MKVQKYHRRINQHEIVVIEVEHNRDGGDLAGQLSNKVMQYQAFTKVVINIDTNRVYVGYAYCSINDQFNKKKGIHIAKGRALKQAAHALGYI